MTPRILMLNAAMTSFIALAVPLQLPAQTWITFDPTNSVATQPTAINPDGVITGFYVDANGVNHGFVRAVDGTITSFDAPGAGTAQGQGTQPAAINSGGVVTGDYTDTNGVNHGFLRAAGGTITTFDAPGAGTAPFQGTQPESINPGGVITGVVCNAATCHGFVRAKNGSFTTFDPPGSGSTVPAGINPTGVITGNYSFALNPFQSVPRGFVRLANGAFDINFPSTFVEDAPTAIDPAGTVAGTYSDVNGITGYFLRAGDGNYTTFAPPDMFIPLTISMNQTTATTGFFITGTIGLESFLRDATGKITVISDPNAGTGFFQGTEAVGINAARQITGTYSDSNGVGHGFLFTP